jgi:hypothetical protein
MSQEFNEALTTVQEGLTGKVKAVKVSRKRMNENPEPGMKKGKGVPGFAAKYKSMIRALGYDEEDETNGSRLNNISKENAIYELTTFMWDVQHEADKALARLKKTFPEYVVAVLEGLYLGNHDT